MDTDTVTVKAVRAGPVTTLRVCGDLDVCEAGRFLGQAALVIDDRTERLVLDLAGVSFLDCGGVRALWMAVSFAPAGCPVIVCSLSPPARRVLGLVGLDLEKARERGAGRESRDRR